MGALHGVLILYKYILYYTNFVCYSKVYETLFNSIKEETSVNIGWRHLMYTNLLTNDKDGRQFVYFGSLPPKIHVYNIC